MGHTTISFKAGQVVRSKCGRDQNSIMIVYEILDDKFVFLVDGKKRMIEKPKKKQAKHLSKYNSNILQADESINELTNAKIRNRLEPFQQLKCSKSNKEQEVRNQNG